MGLEDMQISVGTAVKAGLALLSVSALYWSLYARDTAIAADAAAAKALAAKNAKQVEKVVKSLDSSSRAIELLTRELQHNREMRAQELGEIKRSLNKVERRTRGWNDEEEGSK